jgi:hypothetical protein
MAAPLELDAVARYMAVHPLAVPAEARAARVGDT